MDMIQSHTPRKATSRRNFIEQFGTGLGGIALGSLLAQERNLAQPSGARLPRFAPKAKRVIQLFMNGGASQCDLFDYRPSLEKLNGKPFDPGEGVHVEASVSEVGTLMKSPFTWAQHGQSGRWVSSAIPNLAKHVDDMAFLMAMTSPSNVHGPAAYLQTSGFAVPGFPCMGAWISYALGSLNENVPAFVGLPDGKGFPYNGRSAFTHGFLPANHQGFIVRTGQKEPVAHLTPPATSNFVTPESRRDGLALLNNLNRRHARARIADSRLQARIKSYELAARLQLSAPGLIEINKESQATRELYGIDKEPTADFGRRCLMARRMIERGVRFVQVWSGHGGGAQNWDNHGDIPSELPYIANQMDQPAAALLQDLKVRGLLDDTLLVWTTEFGRMPFTQGTTKGRDHNGGTFVSWFAGAGIKPGVSHGESDEWSWKAATNATTRHDFHATILHLLGMNHEELTVYHNGIDRRLTDVHGHVIKEIVA
jgi:hypothetical protein